MDRDVALDIKDALEGIETSFESIVTALNTIAENTTPSETPAAESNVNDSRGLDEELEEQEEEEETKGGSK